MDARYQTKPVLNSQELTRGFLVAAEVSHDVDEVWFFLVFSAFRMKRRMNM